MNKIIITGLLAISLSIGAFGCGGSSSDGGGGGGNTPTTTSNETKAATQVVVNVTAAAAGQGALEAFQNATPVGAMVVTNDISAKTTYQGDVDTTYECEGGGTVEVTGTYSAECTGNEDADWTCTSMSASMNLAFMSCARQAYLDDTHYEVVVGGSGTATLTGTITGYGDTVSNVTFAGSLGGIPTFTDTVSATADISNLTYTGSGVPDVTIDVECDGTVAVTYDSTSQVCGISTDCTTCTE